MRLIVVFMLAALVMTACSRGQLPADATGEQVYATFCASCHGEDLEGGFGPSLGPGSDAADMTDEFYRFTVENGLGRMPSYGSSLTDEQVDLVVDYMRQVQGGD